MPKWEEAPKESEPDRIWSVNLAKRISNSGDLVLATHHLGYPYSLHWCTRTLHDRRMLIFGGAGHNGVTDEANGEAETSLAT